MIIENENGNNANTLLGEVLTIFFAVLWILAFVAWIVFVCKGMILEMWVANAFMWIGVIGGRIKNFA
jgi:hypothetical protein